MFQGKAVTIKTHKATRRLLSTAIALCLFSISLAAGSLAATLPASERVVVNLGAQPWTFFDGDPAGAEQPGFSDTSWKQVGVPYSPDDLYSFLNAPAGGGDGSTSPASTVWYRTPIVLDSQYANRKVLVEIEGAHVGVQVYINGTLLPGISAVVADAKASHVVGFVPFIVDLTPYLKIDGATKNVLAIRVSKGANFYEDPHFAEGFRFGQGFLGLFRPVKMFITDPVHIPENVYSNLKTWGTHVSTLSASDSSAQVDVQTNVVNEGSSTQPVTVTTQIVDALGNVVQSGSLTQSVAPSALPNFAPQLFDQQLTVSNPTLWYPNSSIYGKPYMYKVFHTVSINGAVVDAVQSPLGIRTITWDANFPYFNGKQQHLWGGSGRYDYPAMASAVPEEQQWRDLQQMAAAGGNLWRPGHSTPSEEFIDAADAYGIMIVDPSGEGEGEFSVPCSPTCDKATLKTELHRDMIIRDRNHPSILSWEADNGDILTSFAQTLQSLVNQWDATPIPRVQADRSAGVDAHLNGYILGCTLSGCENGVKTNNPNNPAWGAEYWNNGTARQAWDYELAFATPFLEDWRSGRADNTFGMVQWYFADTPGEQNNFLEGTLPAGTRTFGTSMVDINRFPKMLYYIYEAAWTPYQNAAGQTHPVVHLAHHWNRAYQGTAPIQVNAFSNCPRVRLLVNGTPQGSDQVPNPWTSVDPNANSYPAGLNGGAQLQASGDIKQQTTTMPFQVHWNIPWVAGTVIAQCLDDLGNVASYNGTPAVDSRTTAGAPHHIALTVVPELMKPDGTAFAITANGSDAAFIEARVVDANGVVVPTDNTDNLTFSVSGPATYKGGSEAYVSAGTDAYVSSSANSFGTGYGVPAWGYHAPGDPELQVEGGMTKVVVRSQFTPGQVTVTASAPGLVSGSIPFTITPAVLTASPMPGAPEIIGQPASTSVTAGQTAQFSVLATGAAPLKFQWSKNGAQIANATSATYTTPATTTGDNNTSYTVTVSNNLQTAPPSNPAVLTVDTPASIIITAQPQAAPAFAGQAVTLTVTATGSPTITYQWKRNGTAISGATSPSYTTQPLSVSTDNGSTYQVVLTNPVAPVPSNVVTLTVNPAVAPAITAGPQSMSVIMNEQANFSVTATGSAPLTYQWQKNGAAINGATSSVLTIPSVQSTDAASYTVVVGNAAASITSDPPAVLTVLPPGPNLALNQQASASSQNGNGNTPASAAFDGNLTTRWDSVEGTSADPSWLAVRFATPQTFNTAVINWDPAFAKAFQLQWSNDGTTWTSVQTPATATLTGNAGAQTITFPAVTAQSLRMYGTVRSSPYGYAIDEMQVYNVASCTALGDPNERFTVQSGNTLVKDNMNGLTWMRTPYTLTAAGSQFTQPLAATYCSNNNMRLPTQSEALGIAGPNLATCAFPQAWSTWTSTGVSNSTTEAYIVASNAVSSPAVATNYPGAVLCTSGIAIAPPSAPTITSQPAAQSVALGQTATFTVAASGTGTLTYQWSRNSSPIAGATSASYTTPATVAADTGTTFSVVVSSSNGTSTFSTPAALTITGTSSGGGGTSGGGTGTTGTDLVAIAAGSTNPIGTFSADTDVVGGGTNTNCTNTIVTAGIAGAGPTALYQPERTGVFTYTIPGLVTGTNYGVRLHFAECYFSLPQQRVFNVLINGATVLPNFDIVQVGGANTAVVRTFTQAAVAGTNGTGQIAISFTAVANEDQPKVDGIEILNLDPITITTQPASQSVTLGQAATFSVAANGGGTLTYQWSRNGIAVVGATNATYITPATAATDNGALFSVAIASAGGIPVTSTAATLTVVQPVTGTDFVAIAAGSANTIGSFSADTDVAGGGVDSNCTKTINTAGVVGAGPAALYQPEHVGVFTYTIPGLVTGTSYGVRLHFAECYFSAPQQRVFNVLINGATVLPNFDIVQVGGANTAVVRTFTQAAVAGTNGTGQIAISFTAVVNKDQPKVDGIEIFNLASTPPAPSAPTITTQPAAATVTAGGSATFTVVAGGTGPFTYQWKKNNVAIANGTGASYTTPATVTADSGSNFSVVVTTGSSSVTSTDALLTVSSGTSSSVPIITTQPVAVTVTVGRTAQFAVTATGTGPLMYQWSRNGAPIPGATSATYITPGTSAADNGVQFSVVASNGSGSSMPSASAGLTVSTANPSTALYPGFLATDLNNNTNGTWANNQIYVEVIGSDPTNNGALVWVNYDGTRHAASVADNTASNHLTGPDGNSYPAYGFTLAQSTLLRLPPGSGRIYVSMGHPMYMPVTPAGSNGINGYAGPNPQNSSDPNINTHYDWYEYTSGLNADGTNNIYINTTQVDYFGLPLLLDMWDGKNGITLGGITAGHGQTGINESIVNIDAEYVAQTPAAFHLTPVSNLRIASPDKSTFVPGQVNANYFDSYISSIWSYYATNSLSITLGNRVFTGTIQGSNFVFTEPNPVAGAAGVNYPIGEPTTENVVACDGVFGTDTFASLPNTDPRRGVESGIETALCATFNRHIVQNPSQWANPTDYYLAAPANYYAQFWHNHSVGALAYGFPYDDFDGYSSTVVSFDAQHMAFGIGW